MRWLCEGHIATRTVQYNRPCPSCAGYTKAAPA